MGFEFPYGDFPACLEIENEVACFRCGVFFKSSGERYLVNLEFERFVVIKYRCQFVNPGFGLIRCELFSYDPGCCRPAGFLKQVVALECYSRS